MKNEEPEPLIETPKQWHVRNTVKQGFNVRKGMPQDTITVELVYGQKALVKGRDDVTRETIEGEVYHTLSGPTAETSMHEMAATLNRKSYIPEGTTTKTRADGYRQGRHDPNTLHQDFELPEQYR